MENTEFCSFRTMFKARPAEEKGERFIYLEASQEQPDIENEVVLAKALAEAAPHFLKFGNIDIDHKSMAPVAKMYGITDPTEWEIGIPVDVEVNGPVTMVKARLFQGDTPLAARANMVWDSMTKLDPPARWYASVGGAKLAKSRGVDPATESAVSLVTKVRWSNLAISRTPVNPHVAAVSTVPFGMLAKCWTPDGWDLAKALEASPGVTDVATMTGGSALGKQSLDSRVKSYFDFRNKISQALLAGESDQSAAAMIAHSVHSFGLSPDEAAAYVDRFMSDLSKTLKRKKS